MEAVATLKLGTAAKTAAAVAESSTSLIVTFQAFIKNTVNGWQPGKLTYI